MTITEEIRNALKKIMSDNEASTCAVWMGWVAHTGWYGWHMQQFPENPVWLGNSLKEVLETIDSIAEKKKGKE